MSVEPIEICDSEDERELLVKDAHFCSDDQVIHPRNHSLKESSHQSPLKRQKLIESKINPFAKFAHQSGSVNNIQVIASRLVTKQPRKTSKKNDKKCNETPPRMETLSPAEVENVKRKWYSFLQEGDSMEDQRFQLLVAARLHARCQDKAVHQAMVELRKSLLPMSFSAETLARADPNQLQECISNLQFYSVKAKQIVQAANEIVDQCGGQVPESESSLIKVTGIGPVFADLLATINTRAEHQKRRGDLHQD
jgi:endonuclease III